MRATSTTPVTGKAVEAMSITTMAGTKPGSEMSAGATTKEVRAARTAPTREGANAALDHMGPNGPMTREQAQAIVRSAYQNVLGREPDPASAGYVDRVFNDHWSQQQIENELRNSAEYRQKHPRR